MGTIWHRAHQQWHANPSIDFKNWIYIEGAGRLEGIKKAYRDRVGAEASNDELAKLGLGIALLGNMAEMYQKYWGTATPKGFKKLGSEVTCIVDVPGSEHKYEGTLDALLIDKNDMLWIGEFKTFEKHPNFESLSTTEQFLDYMWILQQAINQGHIEARGVGGMLYDGAWKRDTKPVDETFIRRKLTRNQYEIEHHTETIAICLNEMGADTFRGTNHPVYNRYYTCSTCKFDLLCIAAMRGSNTDHIIKYHYVDREKQGYALAYGQENFG
jgi:hypothetical protein